MVRLHVPNVVRTLDEQVMKNVLYISYDGMTDPLGQSQVLPYLIGLSKKGINFHLISFEKKDRFIAHEAKIASICKEAGITWHPISYTKSPPLLSTIYDIVRMRRMATKLHKQQAFSLIHCRSYLSSLVGLYFTKRYSIPFLFDMRGFWADERIEGGIWNVKNPVFKTVYSFFKRKEIAFLTKSAATVSLTNAGKKEIESWKSLQSSIDIEVIPCCVDLSLFNRDKIKQPPSLINELNLDEKTQLVGYIGSLGTWYLVDEMFDYFNWLRKRHENFHFVVVTQDDRTIVDRYAKEKGIPSDRYSVFSAQREEIPALIAQFHHSVFFIKPSYSKQASSPTKQAEIMAMGVPIICNSGVGDTAQLVREYTCGAAIDSFEEASFEEAFQSLSTIQPAHAIRGAHSFFDLESGVEKYLSVYKRIWNKTTKN
jgi:glycosyltransferase involved in cell wall biosynthesis